MICFDSTSPFTILYMRLKVPFHNPMSQANHVLTNPTHRRNIPVLIHKLLIIQNNRAMLLSAPAARIMGLRGECRHGLRQHHKRNQTCHHRSLHLFHLLYLHSILPFLLSAHNPTCSCPLPDRTFGLSDSRFQVTPPVVHRPGGCRCPAYAAPAFPPSSAMRPAGDGIL